MERTLSKEGYAVHRAESGARGLERARQLKPSVITLDVLMPGMDGWAVLSAMKADPELADIPVIMLTIIDDKNLGFALGAADYVMKPIERERLNAVLQRYKVTREPRHVLIVEDDPASRDMLRSILEKEEWTIAEAENGRVGLERVAAVPPDLI